MIPIPIPIPGIGGTLHVRGGGGAMVLARHVTRRLLDITITKNINKDKVNVRKKRNRLRPNI